MFEVGDRVKIHFPEGYWRADDELDEGYISYIDKVGFYPYIVSPEFIPNVQDDYLKNVTERYFLYKESELTLI